MSQIRIFFIFCCLLASLHGYGQRTKAEPIYLQFCSLTNLYRIDSALYRSDQPGPGDFIALEKFGIREVLNLRALHDDDTEAQGTSLVLHHLPMYAYWLSEKKLVEALRIIRDRKGPVLVHCYHGSDRTGAVIALYRMVFQGVPKETAIAEMYEPQFGHHRIFFNIRRYLEKVDIDSIRKELNITVQR